MKKPATLFAILTTLLLTACSSSLNVFNENGVALDGLPIRSPVLVTITTQTNYEIAPNIQSSDPLYSVITSLCQPTQSQESKFLPLGELSYVTYDPAYFAKSEFKVEYHESGATKSVSLNSDPAATTESAANLLGAALPLLQSYDALDLAAAARPAVAGDLDLDALRTSSCINKGSEIVSIDRQQIQ